METFPGKENSDVLTSGGDTNKIENLRRSAPDALLEKGEGKACQPSNAISMWKKLP
jgi:hypothetical protein